jgi:hypothetical protein
MSEPRDFAFGALDGSVVTGENTRGRATALLFVTTYDLGSQLAAGQLNELYRRHKPRFNAACVVLEAANNSVLVETFQRTLDLKYPVTLADAVELRASSAFANIDRVPTLVLLDRVGRERWRASGAIDPQELERRVSDAQR